MASSTTAVMQPARCQPWKVDGPPWLKPPPPGRLAATAAGA